jgi:hypothetical protein
LVLLLEQDRRITLFYCQKPDLSQYKKNTVKYLQMMEEIQTEQGKEYTGLPAAAYAGITIVVGIVAVGLILLLKKKASSRSK